MLVEEIKEGVGGGGSQRKEEEGWKRGGGGGARDRTMVRGRERG